MNDWFVASFFPSASTGSSGASAVPAVRAQSPFDEILRLNLDGTWKYLARTGTTYSRTGERGGSADMFWAQSLASPSADGRRICFNSNRSGTIDLFILRNDELGASLNQRGRR
ncbi:MAG: PD40 domain-containing protein [Verrucomicrobia bacterium]|nr:PD40 domain-containing protein [Verrucomicrobiota bacterium]